FDRQADAAILAVNRNDLGFNFVTNFKNVARVFNFLAAQLRGLQYSFNVCSQGHNSSLGFNFFNGTFNDGAFVILGYVLREGIGFQLLDTQGNALALRVDSQHNGFQLVAFLVLAYSFFASFVPGDVGQVNQTIDAAFQTDEDTEVSDGLDFAGDLVAFGAGTGKRIPWVFLTLLQAQRDTTTLFVDIQNHNFDFITQLNNFGRVDVLVGPVHFRHVDQTFNALFQLSEAAVVGQVGNLGFNACTFWIALGDLNPWIFAQLLEAQRYTVTLTVELEYFYFNFVANIHDFARMLDTLPRHISDVQQTVYTAQIHECTVVSEVFNDTFNSLTFLQSGQQFITLSGVGLFQNSATGNNDVVTLLIQFDNFEFQLFTFEVGSFAYWANVYQRAREEGTDAGHVNSETTFDLAIDNTLDNFISAVSGFEDFPGFSALGFFAGQTGFTETVFYTFQSNLNFVTDLQVELA